VWTAVLDPIFERWEVDKLRPEEIEQLDKATRQLAEAYAPALQAYSPVIAFAIVVVGVLVPRWMEHRRKAAEAARQGVPDA